VPNGGIDTAYLFQFNKFIREKIAQKWRFFIVVGGGATARYYIEAAKKIKGNISNWDLDFLGIHATHLNAHLVRTIFQDIAHPRIINNYEKKITNLKEPLVIAAGWKPGCSTDYDAVVLARDYQASVVINMSNITQVYNKDPKVFPDAIAQHALSWEELGKIVGDKWTPGSNLPFDPVATRLAKELSLTVYIVGRDLDNLNKVLDGGEFVGTVVSPS